jgi:sodium/potassium-transporting ATPase subunit alpha
MPLDWSSPLYKQATAATFAGIVVAQVANVFACRSDRVPLAQLGWFSNPLILWGIATELIVLAFIIYTPWGNEIFGTSPLPVWIFGPLALGALVLLFAEESRKFIMSRCTGHQAGTVTQLAGTR